MSHQQPPNGTSARAPAIIGHDLRSNFAELWESVRDRAVHTFDKLKRDDLLAVRSFDELRLLVKRAYSYDDAGFDAAIDRFVNEGGSTHTSGD